jgi:flavin reductase (DIM6/NTAB) family NADH-FMN oxidoreductase RutF
MQILELGTHERASNNLVVAWVVCIHVDDDAIDNYEPLAERLDLVGRMGGDDWCTTRDRFQLPRPASRDPEHISAGLRNREVG